MRCLQSRDWLVALLTVCATLGQTLTASSADLGSGPASPIASFAPWSVKAMPYGWLPFLKGDVTVRGRTKEIDVNPWEVLENLDAVPWMSYVEARRGPLAFYNDIFSAKLGVDVSGSRTFGAVTLDAALGINVTQTIVEVGGTYEIAKWRSGGGNPDVFARYTAIDVLAGARYWHQELSLDLALTGTLDTTGLVITGTRAIGRSGSVDWVDPVVGARVRHQFARGRNCCCAVISVASTWAASSHGTYLARTAGTSPTAMV